MKSFALIVALLLSSSLYASSKTKTHLGNILRLSVVASGSEMARTIDIQGFDNEGVESCYQSDTTDVVTMMFETGPLGDSQYSMALAAYLANTKVRAKVDEAHMSGAYCMLRLIQLCKTDAVCK